MSKDNSVSKNEETLKALDSFLDNFLNPAFGSLSKTEIEIHVLKLLEQTGKITEEEKSSQYKLAVKLKVSPTKAKNLLYNWSLRKEDDEKGFNEMLEEILLNLKRNAYKNEGGWFFLQIENPLLLEYVKNRIQELGHIQDGSFSSKIIKLRAKALNDLIDDCTTKEKKSEILKKLGISENKFKELVIGTAKGIVARHITESGVELLGTAAGTAINLIKSKIPSAPLT